MKITPTTRAAYRMMSGQVWRWDGATPSAAGWGGERQGRKNFRPYRQYDTVDTVDVGDAVGTIGTDSDDTINMVLVMGDFRHLVLSRANRAHSIHCLPHSFNI